MRSRFCTLATAAVVATVGAFASTAYADRDSRYHNNGYEDHYDGHGYYDDQGERKRDDSVQLGPRPFYLVEGMDAGRLKDRLMRCQDGPFYKTDFSIGHRGAALQFPEHIKESYEAGARQGAGIVECDVTFTENGDLVCRHSDCDLHTTTDILTSPLREKCERPWGSSPGGWDGPFDPNDAAAGPKCCTWNLSLDEFKSLQGKMDAGNASATSLAAYMNATASWRTDLYTGRGTLMTFRDSIELNQKNGVKHTPELKGGDPTQIEAIFHGQEQYAQKFADELEAAGVKPRDVWPQSFNLQDVLYWIDHTPYGDQAVYLVDYDAAANTTVPPLPLDELQRLKARGVRIIAPPIPALLAVDADNRIVPSPLANDLKRLGFDIITWTFERSDLRQGASQAGFYFDFDPQGRAVRKDSDMYKALDVLARQVKILGIFSDWPATVTYYANCMGLK